MPYKENKLKNPIIYLSQIVSTIGGAISLGSLISDVVVWKRLPLRIILLYQDVTYPIFNFITSWLPFKLPEFICDYIVIGLIVFGSNFKAMKDADHIRGFKYLFPTDLFFEGIFERIFLWPILIVYYTIRALIGYDEPSVRKRWEKFFSNPDNVPQSYTFEKAVNEWTLRTYGEYVESVRFLLWLGSVIFILVLLCIVFSQY